jgi:hypothetical protein
MPAGLAAHVTARALASWSSPGHLVRHETQYFADPFQVPPWRAALAEPIPDGDR